MEWQQITITTTHQGKEIVGGLLVSHGVRGFVTQDPEDFQEFLEDTTVHWDYIEEDLLSLKEGETTVTFYLPENLQGAEMLGAIRAGLTRLPGENPTLDLGSLELKMDTVREEDWSTAWKKYYHPVRVGQAAGNLPLLGDRPAEPRRCAGHSGPRHGLRHRHPRNHPAVYAAVGGLFKTRPNGAGRRHRQRHFGHYRPAAGS